MLRRCRQWWPWRSADDAPADQQPAGRGHDEDTVDGRRRLALERTYAQVQEQEQEMRAAADRIQTELEVLRRER